MAVYVDPLFCYGGSASFRWRESCHMFADSDAELHRFARLIGLKRTWHQISNRGFSHYDLNKRRRQVAVREGAVEVGFEFVGRRLKSLKA